MCASGRSAHSLTRGGGVRPIISARYSARLRDRANSALKKRCCTRLSRRMSITYAVRGRTRAMYEKFWSGPTPTYAPPRGRADHVQVAPPARDQVVGVEEAARLRERGDERAELGRGERARAGPRCGLARRRPHGLRRQRGRARRGEGGGEEQGTHHASFLNTHSIPPVLPSDPPRGSALTSSHPSAPYRSSS